MTDYMDRILLGLIIYKYTYKNTTIHMSTITTKDFFSLYYSRGRGT
jgi:hypothetical protein